MKRKSSSSSDDCGTFGVKKKAQFIGKNEAEIITENRYKAIKQASMRNDEIMDR